MATTQNVDTEAKHGILAVAIIILAGLIIAFAFRNNLQHQSVFWIITAIATVAYAIFAYRFFTYIAPNNDGARVQWSFIIATAIWLGLVVGVVVSAKSNRDQCIPKTQLVDGNGYIPDGQAYVDFQSTCPDNQIVYDQITREYIVANHHMPAWAMDNTGYTTDPVGWWNAHNGNPANTYKLSPQVQNYLYSSHHLPKDVLDHPTK
jgi:hypothetical protein